MKIPWGDKLISINLCHLLFLNLFVLIIFFISCNDGTIGDDTAPILPAIQTVTPLYQIDSIPTGVPIFTKGKRIDPDSIQPPEVTPVSVPHQVTAPHNRKLAKPSSSISVQKDKLQIVIPAKDDAITVRPLDVKVEKVFAIHNPTIAASPPRFKDNATHDIRYLDVDQGLNDSYQTTICAARTGYMWFGGWSGGLCRYDGKSFLRFTEKEGLVYSEVNDIFEDKEQNLWIATKRGLSKYDGFTFTNFTLGLDFDICAITEDDRGNIWLATYYHGLLRYDGTQFTQYLIGGECTDKNFTSILVDGEQIWVGTYCGLLKYDGRSFTRFTEEDGLIDNQINRICQDSTGNVWIASEGGFCQFNGTSFTRFTAADFFVDDAILSILADRENIWLGTGNNGLIKYDGTYFTQYSLNEGISNENITDLWRDHYGQLWLATYGGGINRFNTVASFAHFAGDQHLEDKIIHQILTDRAGNLWMLTKNQGIIVYDGQQYTFYDEQNGLPTNALQTMMEDRNGQLWLGSADGSGVIKFADQSFIRYGEEQGLQGGVIWSIVEDAEGSIWLATDQGVSKFAGQSFVQFTKEEGMIDDYAYHVSKDNQENIWISTEQGVTRYDGVSFTHFTTQEGLVSNSIVSVMQDKRGFYWIATYNGLSVYDGNEFFSFTKSNGLGSEQVWAIAEDHLGNIWLGTEYGVYLIELPQQASIELNDLQETPIQAFHKMDGLKAEDIHVNGVYLDRQQQMWFASGKGLMYLDLNEFYANRNKTIPQLAWNHLQLNENYIDFNRLNFTPTTAGISFTAATASNQYPQGLTVAHDVNHLTFNFIGFDWNAPHHLQYQYQLEGLENNWSQPTTTNEVDYRSIPSGDYTFKVKAAGQANIWSEPLTYDFTVLPPWWLSWWAYSIYIFLLLALFYAIVNFFRNRLILKNELKLKAAESLRLQELDGFKNRLITNLTHEFRTPLTVILGMTNQIKEKPEKYLDKGTTLIENNGKNLLRLVDQLLDLAKLESQSFQLNWTRADIVPYLAYLSESFQSYAENKGVELHFHTTVETLVMDYDAEQIKQVLNNLISNAIKFTSAGGEILVQLLVENQHLLIAVKDTGIGIAPEHLPHIFERFYQVTTANKFSGNGTGIGLAHAHELVQLMGGKIAVKSELQRGTSFQVYLPILQRTVVKEKLNSVQLKASSSATSTVSAAELSVVENQGLPQLLIVEDNADVMLYLKSCLEELYELHFALNGKTGVEKALAIIPDLIISDVMMPEMNGYELCDVLKNDERSSHIPIILLTAKADIDSKMEGLRKGADVYLAKPFDKAELLLRLEKMTQRQEKLKNYFSKNITNPATVEHLPPAEKEIVQTEHIFIEKVKAVIAENYENEQFALPQLCEQLNLSRTQLYRKMKALINVSPSKFIRSYRLEQAKKLLGTTDLTVAEVAYAVGFKERSHFSKVFNDEFGTYPTEIDK